MTNSAETNPADTIIGLYERHAAAFDDLRGKTLLEASWLDRFLALVPEHASILDIGCGSGVPIARHCLAKGHSVTGIDSSNSLIALCRRRFPQAAWHVQDMRRLALGRSFDALLDSEDHITGSFSPSECPAIQSAIDNSGSAASCQ